MRSQSTLVVTLVMSWAIGACRPSREEVWSPPSSITSAEPALDSARPTSQRRVLPAANIPTGSLAQSAVQKTLHRHRNELRFCFESQAQPSAPPSAAGTLLVEAGIAATGQVTSVGVVQHVDGISDSLERCLVSAVKRWTFPTPVGGDALVSLELQP